MPTSRSFQPDLPPLLSSVSSTFPKGSLPRNPRKRTSDIDAGQGDDFVSSLSKSRKRGRSEFTGDFDDEEFPTSQRTTKSAQNGGSFMAGLPGSFNTGDEESNDEDDGAMKESFFSDIEYRRNCGTSSNGDGDGDHYDDFDNRGGKRRILDVVGSVVGAVWEFCKSQAPSLTKFMPSKASEYFDTPYNMPPEMFESDSFGDGPPGFPPSNFDRPELGRLNTAQNFFHQPTSPASPSRTSQRHRPTHLDFNSPSSAKAPDNSMSNSWVLVKPNEASTAGSPTRSSYKASSASTRTGNSGGGARPSTPIYTSSSPVALRRNGTYSRVVPRKARPFARSATSGPSFSPNFFDASMTSGASSPGSPKLNKGSGASEPSFRGHKRHGTFGGSPNFFQNTTSTATEAGLRNTPPLRKHASVGMLNNTNRKDEADESISRFNKQLKAMIKEGREALGSTIEVVDGDDEDHWA